MQSIDRDRDLSNASDRNLGLGGAGADFVASLGKKGAEARSTLGALAADPKSGALRDELRRRLTTIAQGAKSFRLDELDRAVGEGLHLLEKAPGEAVSRATVANLNELLFDLPSLAWGETQRRPKGSGFVAEKLASHTALVVGPKVVADALSNDVDSARTYFACHQTEDAQAAMDLARVVAPDIILLDADLPDVPELVEALMDDPLTEPVPMVVVGSFGDSGEGARYVAMGVSRTLSKPLSREELRRGCESAVLTSENRTQRVVLGDPTVEELGKRLADELRRALVDSVDQGGRSTRVSLGEGTEVLGAVWGAIARVREIVTARTDGQVRFSEPAPEGAIAFAPPLHLDAPRYDRGPRRRGVDGEVRLTGRRVLVADDDPGVTWFVADLLKSAGCVVSEAVCGDSALELAYRTTPDLVISDLLMPGMDGFAFCRALRRDVALRDTPFLLLSWKEDLLQRVRELGAGAAGYLRKESDARAIVGRVREVLRPRARVEARLKVDGEVRGRLDDLSVRSLLDIVCATRPAARVSVRDASFLHEIEIRDGAPVSAIRTDANGNVLRGAPVLESVLGVGVGRFVVQDSSGEIETELTGSLHAQLALPVARARAALYLTTGARAMGVEHLELREDVLADAMRVVTPETRRIVDRLVRGATPKDLVLGGIVDAAWLDDVMSDLAARGAFSAIRGPSGRDLFAERISIALGEKKAPATLREKTPAPYEASLAACGDSAAFDLALEREALRKGLPLEPEASPSSLLGAVVQEIDTRASGKHAAAPAETSALIEAKELKPRSSPRMVDDVEIPRAFEAEPTVLDTVYGDEDQSISIPIPEPEAELTPGPQVADLDDEDVRRPLKRSKKKSVFQLLATLFGVIGVAYLVFHAQKPGAKPALASGASVEAPVAVAPVAPSPVTPVTPVPTYRDVAGASGQGVLEVLSSKDEVVAIDGVPREKTAKLVTSLPVGRHDVRLGESAVTVTVDVREGKAATLTLP